MPRRVEAQEPLARALVDHFESGRPVALTALREEGFSYTIDTSEFFELETGRTGAIDAKVLEVSRGQVLDAAAGAGRHALALQARGLEVRALDISPALVRLMHRRGVEDAVVGDLNGCAGGPYDTILLLMQSIGIGEDRPGVESLLRRLVSMLTCDGQLLVDSSPLVVPDDEGEGFMEGEQGAEVGVEVAFTYRNLLGAPFRWIYLDEATLIAWCSALGLRCDVLVRTEEGEYLARIQPE